MQTKLLNDSQICILATERNKFQPLKKLKKMGVRVLKNRPKSSREKQILSVKIAGKRLKIVFGYFFFHERNKCSYIHIIKVLVCKNTTKSEKNRKIACFFSFSASREKNTKFWDLID